MKTVVSGDSIAVKNWKNEVVWEGSTKNAMVDLANYLVENEKLRGMLTIAYGSDEWMKTV